MWYYPINTPTWYPYMTLFIPYDYSYLVSLMEIYLVPIILLPGTAMTV